MSKLDEIYIEARKQVYLAVANEINSHPEKTYQTIASEMQTSLPIIYRVVKLYSLNRSVGRKRKLPLTDEG
jgi:hypothetical protein